MTNDPRPSQRRVREVGVRIADALAAAHLLGVLHRDVKPANILIDAYNNAGLADFGLAALIDPDMPLSETVGSDHPRVRAARGLRQAAAHRVRRCLFPRRPLSTPILSGHPPRWSETTEMPSIPEIIKRQKAPIKRITGVDKAFMDVLLKAMAEQNRRTGRPRAQFRDQLAALNLSTQLAPTPQATLGASSRGVRTSSAVSETRHRSQSKPAPAATGRAGNWERRGAALTVDHRRGDRSR